MTGKGNGGAGPPQRKPRFPGEWAGTAPLILDSNPVIKGYLERGGFGVIYGPPSSGKSFLTADICQHVARELPWRGHKTVKGLVVYVAAEAGKSILRRFVGWRNDAFKDQDGIELTPETLPLRILERGPNLLDADAIDALMLEMLDLEIECGHKVALVVFDTLSQSMIGGDENSAVDMTKVVAAAHKLREKFGCATLYVHHTGKDVELGARGHSSLKGAVDLEISVVDRLATLVKLRDGIAGEKFYFTLKGVDLGNDSDGEVVGTCVVEYADTVPAGAIKSKSMGKNQKPVLDALKALSSKSTERSPGYSGIPKGVALVRVSDLCASLEPQFPDFKPWQIKRRVGEAIRGLPDHAGLHGEFCWLQL